MKKTRIAVAYLATALAVASAQTQAPLSGEGAVTNLSANGATSLTSFSARFGYMGFRGGFFDNGLAGQVEFKTSLDESDLDFVVRGHYAFAKTDKGETVRSVRTYSLGQWRVFRIVAMENCEETVYGGSAQIQYNFNRNASMNPYIAAGLMYERTDFEYDLGYLFGARPASSSDDNADRHRKGDEDGFAIVGRVGVEFNPDPFYIRLEAAFVSEIYEEDDGRQIEFNGIVGTKITDSIRLDVAGTRFTDWKEYYITAGLTYLF